MAKHLEAAIGQLAARVLAEIEMLKLRHPRKMLKNPVMFVVEVGSVLTTLQFIRGVVAPVEGVTNTSFESALSRLSEIVERLEGGELPLEESLKLFEEGVRLARTAEARLEAAEKRVEELLGIDSDGNPIVRELGENGG